MSKLSTLARILITTLTFAVGAPSAQAAVILVNGTTAITETVTYNGIKRNVIWVKPKVTGTAKTPLLVMLHCGGCTAEKMANLAHASELVSSTGITVMLPDGVNKEFNNDPANSTGVDDVGFLTNRIDYAVQKYSIDSKKVYMTGYSNGGFMAQRYACERPDKVAAIAVATNTMRKSLSCDLKTTMPMAIIAGTADKVLAFEGYYWTMLGAMDTAAKFASINRCTGGMVHSNLPDLVTTDNSQVTLDEYQGCANGSKVSVYSVIGGGHTWAGSAFNLPGLGAVNMDIDATYTAWNFVSQFSR